MPAFYYLDGKVYIKHLVLWGDIEYDDGSAFGEAASGHTGGGTSTGGSSGVETNTVTYGNPNQYTHEVFVNGVSTGRESHTASYQCGKCGYAPVYGYD